MFKVQQNRYLWVHLVGLATVPLLLDICLAGLASAGPALPFKLQFWIVALVGIVPSAWMQIQRPLSIYALPPLAVKPNALNEDDRRCLTVLTSWQIKALAGVTAGFSLWLLARLYDRLPQISPVMKPGAGLIIAIAAFFFICLFLQISVSVLRSLLIGQDTLQRVKPFEPSEITSSFLIPGLRVSKILPTVAIASNSLHSKSRSKPAEAPNKETKDVAPIEKPLEKSIAPDTEEISIDPDRAEPETVSSAVLEPQNDVEEAAAPSVEQIAETEKIAELNAPSKAQKSDSDPSRPISPELMETTKPIQEDPPLVIPEIIESDDFEANGSR